MLNKKLVHYQVIQFIFIVSFFRYKLRRLVKLEYYIEVVVNFQALLYSVSDLHRLRLSYRERLRGSTKEVKGVRK
jgi:hypothetical protein